MMRLLFINFLFIPSLVWAQASHSVSTPEQKINDPEQIKKIKSDYKILDTEKKCTQILFEDKNNSEINYSATYHEYQKIRADFSKKSNLKIEDLNVKNEMNEPTGIFETQNDPDFVMRMKWAIQIYKQHKGKVLPIIDRSDKKARIYQLKNQHQTAQFEMNLPRYYKMCRHLDDLNLSLNNHLIDYKSENANCLKWIQNNQWLQGENPGLGPLADMKIHFDKDEKLEFDGMKANYQRENNQEELIITKGDKFTNGNKLSLTRDEQGKLKKLLIEYKDSWSGGIIKNEIEFKYIGGQCYPNIISENNKQTPSLVECRNENYSIQYNEGRLILPSAQDQNDLYKKYFYAQGSLYKKFDVSNQEIEFQNLNELENKIREVMIKQFGKDDNYINKRISNRLEEYWETNLTQLERYCKRYEALQAPSVNIDKNEKTTQESQILKNE